MKGETLKILIGLPCAIGSFYALAIGYNLVAIGLIGVVVLLVGPTILASELDLEG